MRVAIYALAASILLWLQAIGSPAYGQGDEPPYWVSLKVDRANMRVGPDRSYPIDWVYVRRGLPLKVVRKSGGWRLVEDQDGARGWMLARFLTRDRSAVVINEGYAPIHAEASSGARLLWRAQPGVIGQLGECAGDWCEFRVDDKQGWVQAERIWGDGAP